jgi:hypothetical protein
MTRIIWILALIAITASTARAQFDFSNAPFVVSPGIKLGFASGDAGGFTVGVELSAGYWDKATVLDAFGGTFIGGVIDYDVSVGGRGKLHFGAEATLGPVGVDVGPTLVFENGTTRLATTVTPFIGVMAMPYYSMTFADDQPTITEWGAYGKLPFRTDGEPLVKF